MMEGWESHKIKDLDIKLIDGDRGKQYPKKKEFLDEGYCLFLNTSNVRKDGFDFNTTSFITKEKDELLRKGKLSRHDIILTTRGTIGNIAIYNDNVTFDNIRINSGMLIIRANKQQFNNNYLFQYFKSSLFQEQVKLFQYGAAQPQLPIGTLNHIKIVEPPLKTQYKIASILSAYDDLIENNLKRIKLLEEQAQQTYEEWFVRFKFPDYENVEIDAISGLPVGWEKKDLNYLCNKITDGTHATPKQVDEGYKLITGKHIGEGFVNFESAYLISEEDHFSIRKRSGLDKGDILFSNIGTLGNIAVVTEDFEYSCKNVIIFKKKDFFQNYLYCYLTNTNTKNKLDNQSSGVAQKFYSLGFIRNFKDNFPNEELVQNFDKVVSPLFQLKYNLFNQNQHLKEARDILLPRLMSGMIDVDGLERDERLGMVAEERGKYN